MSTKGCQVSILEAQIWESIIRAPKKGMIGSLGIPRDPKKGIDKEPRDT